MAKMEFVAFLSLNCQPPPRGPTKNYKKGHSKPPWKHKCGKVKGGVLCMSLFEPVFGFWTVVLQTPPSACAGHCACGALASLKGFALVVHKATCPHAEA